MAIFISRQLTLSSLDWIEMGRLRIQDNVVWASDEVSFFLAHPHYEEKAISALKAFMKQLPPKVRQAGKYLNQEN